MNRLWAHFWAASFAAGLGGVMLPACAHDDSTLYIQEVVAPPLPTNLNQGCLYQAPSLTTTFLPSGILDVGLASSYGPFVIVGNQLLTRADPTVGRTETNRVQLRGAVVRVTDSAGNQLSTFTSLTEGNVEPSIGLTAGLGEAAVIMVDPGTRDALLPQLPHRTDRKTIVSYFKVFGNTTGGTYVESNEYQHVITVCNGCLVSFPPDAVDTNKATPNCALPFPVGTQIAGGVIALPCVQGQDQPIDCRLCQGLDACDPQKLR